MRTARETRNWPVPAPWFHPYLNIFLFLRNCLPAPSAFLSPSREGRGFWCFLSSLPPLTTLVSFRFNLLVKGNWMNCVGAERKWLISVSKVTRSGGFDLEPCSSPTGYKKRDETCLRNFLLWFLAIDRRLGFWFGWYWCQNNDLKGQNLCLFPETFQ